MKIIYRTTVAKKKQTQNLKLCSLRCENLPPYAKESNETKCLYAILKCANKSIHKFSKVLVDTSKVISIRISLPPP